MIRIAQITGAPNPIQALARLVAFVIFITPDIEYGGMRIPT